MTEESAGFPNLGVHDWTAMEALANGVEEDNVNEHVVPVVLTEEMILKRVLWDVAPHSLVAEVSKFLGLAPSSEDGLDMEHTEVHQRMLGAMVVAPYAQMLASHTSRAILGTMIVMDEATEQVPLDSEEFNETLAKFEASIFAATLSVLAELIDWNVVHTPQFEVVMVDTDEEDNSSGE